MYTFGFNDETPIHDAAKSGDKLRTLEAVRDKVAAALDGADTPRDVAALSKQLLEAMAAIERERAGE